MIDLLWIFCGYVLFSILVDIIRYVEKVLTFIEILIDFIRYVVRILTFIQMLPLRIIRYEIELIVEILFFIRMLPSQMIAYWREFTINPFPILESLRLINND